MSSPCGQLCSDEDSPVRVTHLHDILTPPAPAMLEPEGEAQPGAGMAQGLAAQMLRSLPVPISSQWFPRMPLITPDRPHLLTSLPRPCLWPPRTTPRTAY
jgi:hypothetical protein